MPNLTIESGDLKGQQVPVEPGSEFRIGRGEDNELTLVDAKASRVHARILTQGDAFLLEDLDSTNGTRVNDHTVTRRILQDGDVIRIGRARLVFHANSVAAQPAMVAPKVDLDLPPPKAAPKFDLPPPKKVKVPLVAGRGRAKKAPEKQAVPKKRPDRNRRRRR
jgi:pSer/pThr/pTyr-binding forkhead associated (FHA) protein